MQIRQGKIEDLPNIMNIYKTAREFMKKNGNSTQWADKYPKQTMIEEDISNGNCYVCEENEKILGVFAFIIGEDVTYKKITHGQWSSDERYGTIHRLASDGQKKGIAKCCFDFCKTKCSYLRIDTHKDNKPMQAAVRKYGFRECGIIHVLDGSERIAFDLRQQ